MKIQVNSDSSITTSKEFITFVQEVVDQSVQNFKEHITRVVVHFSDENGNKFGTSDKRCVMEARLEGRQPIAVTDDAATLHEVTNGAAEKLKHALKTILGREFDKRRERHHADRSPEVLTEP